MQYNWQQKDWPQFKYDLQSIRDKLLLFVEEVGHINGLLKVLSDTDRSASIVDIMIAEAIKTSAIEGEFLSRIDVMSSIKNNIGITPFQPVKDKRAKGIGQLVYTVRNTFKEPLTELNLHAMHSMLLEGSKGIKLGKWRSGTTPMQVVSGSIGKETIHFEAPPSQRVSKEMAVFIQWFNNTLKIPFSTIDTAPVRSALVHLYFESIHPYEDGNGRIGRALSEKALYQGIGLPIPISLSNAIEINRQEYYQALMNAQKSNTVTEWIIYFVNTILQAQQHSKTQIKFTLEKTNFFDRLQGKLNTRQEKVIRRMLQDGPNSFPNGMNAKKYMSIAKTSKATATRDMQSLVVLKVFFPIGGGRSTRYELKINS